MERLCEHCGEEIPTNRLAVKPFTRTCVPCLQKAGDVRRVKRYDEHDQHGNEIASVYFTDDPDLEAYMRRIVTSPHLPTADEILTDDSNEVILESEHMANVFEHAFDGHGYDNVATAKKNANNEEVSEVLLPGKILVIKSSQEVQHGDNTEYPADRAD